jgi:iron complex outermembrane receptor protein
VDQPERRCARGAPRAAGMFCLSHMFVADAASPDTIVVVGTVPLQGLSLPLDQIPANAQVAGELELLRTRPTTVADLLNRDFAAVHVNEAQSNPFQPDVSFRGFTASPLLGNPIGLSVYVDGVRVNESFGDTVLWDLIPTDALTSIQLLPGANPAFGLNTLGGALALRTLSGRDLQGIDGRLSIGSYDRRALSLRAGGTYDELDGFVALNGYDEDGWRDYSPSRVRQAFGKAGWQRDETRIELAYTHASNSLIGNGLAPEPWLQSRRETVYTHPDESEPRLDFAVLTLSHAFDAGAVLSANAYHRHLQISTTNGDAEFDDAGTPLVPEDDAYEAENRRTETDQRTDGGTLQLAWHLTWRGLPQRIATGATLDRGRAGFRQFEQPAEFTPERGTTPVGDYELDTHVEGSNTYRGLYATGTFAWSDALTLTASARYNEARVTIEDLSGEEPELDGRHEFSRLNAALGGTYEISPTVSVFAGYDEGFRVPTPVELTCADPEAPCSLPVGFVADPPLDPVVAQTWELGLRAQPAPQWRIHAAAYTTRLRDDILFTAVGGSQGFFANVPQTRRRGLELGVDAIVGRWRIGADYALVDATFDSSTPLFNPVANPLDPAQPATIAVDAGDRLPGVPRHLFRLNADWDATARLALGVNVQYASEQWLRGDESNDTRPLGGYTVVNLRGSYALGERVRLFAKLDNAFDRDYATLGAYNRNAFTADGTPREGTGPGPAQRFVSPATPRSVWAGIEFDLGSR